MTLLTVAAFVASSPPIHAQSAPDSPRATSSASAPGSALQEVQLRNVQAVDSLNRGHFTAAFVAATAAVNLCERTPGVPPRTLAASLNNLGEAVRGLRRNKDAIPLLESALRVLVENLPAFDQSIADSCSNLAAAMVEDGRFEEAEILLKEALHIDSQNTNLRATLAHTSNLGVLQSDSGEYEVARDTLRKALTLSASLPDTAALSASLSNNLGTVLHALHDYRGALSLFDSAVTAMRRAPVVNERELAETLLDRASASMRLSHDAEAVRDAREVLTLVPPDDPLAEGALGAMALGLCAQGKDAEADRQLDTLADFYRSPDAARNPAFAGYLETRAEVLWAEGKLADAIEWYERAATAYERVTAAETAFGTEAGKLAHLERMREFTDEIASLQLKAAPDDMRATRVAFEAVLRFKGRALESIAEARHSSQASHGLAVGRSSWVDSMTESNARARASLKSDPADRKLDSLLAEQQRLLADMRRTLQAGEALANFQKYAAAPEVGLQDLRSRLPPGSALIEIGVHSPIDPRKPGTRGASHYVAYVLRSAGEPRSVDLGPVDTMNKYVHAAQGRLSTSHSSYRDATKRLSAVLFAPIVPLVGEDRELYIAPDGELNLVPFAALTSSDGRYVVETHQITYLTSGRELLRFAHEAPPQSPPVVFAAPDYDAKPAGDAALTPPIERGVSGGSIRLPCLGPLEGTRREADIVSSVLRLPVDAVHEGVDATETLLEQVHGPSILHVASHGFFLDGSEQACGTRNVGVTMKAPAAPRPRASIADTLLRSGIALAGANRPPIGRDDGVVTALELANVDLTGTELVVLSACDTGLGRPSAGEGVYGLRRALVIAGAQTELLSLWNVSDSRTVDLMQRYYSELAHAGGRSEALRAAQLGMLDADPHLHPYYWAPFIVSGDPGPLSVAKSAVR
jgi:CHAT domain-containing protein/Tfp pilus assembly protein PilF